MGALRYDFFVGSVQGHTYLNAPWVHSSMFSFRPTDNFEFAFQRTVIWGGKGHAPVTLHTFFKSFFSFGDTTGAVKISREDPGARYSGSAPPTDYVLYGNNAIVVPAFNLTRRCDADQCAATRGLPDRLVLLADSGSKKVRFPDGGN